MPQVQIELHHSVEWQNTVHLVNVSVLNLCESFQTGTENENIKNQKILNTRKIICDVLTQVNTFPGISGSKKKNTFQLNSQTDFYQKKQQEQRQKMK